MDRLQRNQNTFQQQPSKLLSEEVPSDYTPNGIMIDDNQPDKPNSMQMRKDRLLADRSPQAYCADRCVATGNCEVYEDMFHLSPSQVVAFCEECVLSDDEEVSIMTAVYVTQSILLTLPHSSF